MPIKDLKIDLNLIPTTLDALHIVLLCVLLLLALFLVVLLSIIVLRLFKRDKQRTANQSTAVKNIAEKNIAELDAVARSLSESKPEPEPEPVKLAVTKLTDAKPDAALQLLGLLQQEARFLDFVSEDVSQYSDSEIGAAARVVHEGCSKIVKQHFDVEPVRTDKENSQITLPKGFNASENRITGNIVGKPPFTGTLLHRGWRAVKVDLPRLAPGHDVQVLAPAEIEL
ncbi:MAG: DUF2760 domain-containing protein [Gammaproteobacteria bacterium]|nr:DUF2760 domain-containing protein [Gammaproteobacteria bacterium]